MISLNKLKTTTSTTKCAFNKKKAAQIPKTVIINKFSMTEVDEFLAKVGLLFCQYVTEPYNN